jgi:hypothetical protein
MEEAEVWLHTFLTSAPDKGPKQIRNLNSPCSNLKSNSVLKFENKHIYIYIYMKVN